MTAEPDAIFADPRLASVHDVLDPDRSDLEAYLAIAAEFGAASVPGPVPQVPDRALRAEAAPGGVAGTTGYARYDGSRRRLARNALDHEARGPRLAGQALDVGCGTGVFALLLAARGVAVTGVDPAAASLAIARAKPGAERVRWLHGDATGLPPMQVDLATMTGNVAQAIVDPAAWTATLRGVHAALRPGGHLVFETRRPAREAWRRWTREHTYRRVEVDGVGAVESWHQLRSVDGPLVTFSSSFAFASDGAVLRSGSTLRFRDRGEVEADLQAGGFRVDDVREAPDRPGLEFVFVATRP